MKKTLALIAFLLTPATASAYNYVDPATLPPQLISAPNDAASELNLAELAEIKKVQKEADDITRKNAILEQKLAPEIVARAFGDEFNRHNLPYLFHFLDRVGDDCHDLSDQTKAFWKNSRPFVVDKEVNLLVRALSNGSYPSGHAMCSLVWAEVLGQLFPDKLDMLRAKAKESADFRLVVGVHYPTDLRAGERMGLIFLGALQQSKKYQDDLAEIKKQLRN